MHTSRNNPLVGVFRHSPSSQLPANPKILGLRSIIYGSCSKPPLFSQLQVQRDVRTAQPIKYNVLSSLRQYPPKKYSSSVGSRSSISTSQSAAVATTAAAQGTERDSSTLSAAHSANGAVRSRAEASSERASSGSSSNLDEVDPDGPTCAICLVPYRDGDEIRTLACNHCFHSECVSQWVFHRCLSKDELTSLDCPECRQDHVALSESGSTVSYAEGISRQSFLQAGQYLLEEGGYDFLSDFGSDAHSPFVCSRQPTPSSTPGLAVQWQLPMSPHRARSSANQEPSEAAKAGAVDVSRADGAVDRVCGGEIGVQTPPSPLVSEGNDGTSKDEHFSEGDSGAKVKTHAKPGDEHISLGDQLHGKRPAQDRDDKARAQHASQSTLLSSTFSHAPLCASEYSDCGLPLRGRPF